MPLLRFSRLGISKHHNKADENHFQEWHNEDSWMNNSDIRFHYNYLPESNDASD